LIVGYALRRNQFASHGHFLGYYVKNVHAEIPDCNAGELYPDTIFNYKFLYWQQNNGQSPDVYEDYIVSDTKNILRLTPDLAYEKLSVEFDAGNTNVALRNSNYRNRYQIIWKSYEDTLDDELAAHVKQALPQQVINPDLGFGLAAYFHTSNSDYDIKKRQILPQK
jgi:hypothetical protein